MVIATVASPLVDNEEEQVGGDALDCEDLDEEVKLAGDPTDKRQKQEEKE